MNATPDQCIYHIRAHITKQELAARFIVGDTLIEDEGVHHKSEIAWLRHLAKRRLSRDQAQRYMRCARRFSLEQRNRIIEAQLPWKAVELLARRGVASEYVDQFLDISPINPTIDQCMTLLHDVLYPSVQAETSSETAMPTKEVTRTFLEYLENTIQSMKQYLAEVDKGA